MVAQPVPSTSQFRTLAPQPPGFVSRTPKSSRHLRRICSYLGSPEIFNRRSVRLGIVMQRSRFVSPELVKNEEVLVQQPMQTGQELQGGRIRVRIKVNNHGIFTGPCRVKQITVLLYE